MSSLKPSAKSCKTALLAAAMAVEHADEAPDDTSIEVNGTSVSTLEIAMVMSGGAMLYLSVTPMGNVTSGRIESSTTFGDIEVESLDGDERDAIARLFDDRIIGATEVLLALRQGL